MAGDLRARAVEFGEALQLVNILKDSQSDGAEQRTYLPREASLAEVFSLARADLRRAIEYTELLRTAGADRGIVAFNALNLRLAIGTLHLLRTEGPGAKLTRTQVAGIAGAGDERDRQRRRSVPGAPLRWPSTSSRSCPTAPVRASRCTKST